MYLMLQITCVRTHCSCWTRLLPGQFFPGCHHGQDFCRGVSWLSATVPVYGWVTCTEWPVYSNTSQ